MTEIVVCIGLFLGFIAVGAIGELGDYLVAKLMPEISECAVTIKSHSAKE